MIKNDLLFGKHICYLGSSVTYGSASGGHSFAEDIAERNGNTFTKEAVGGTTLVDNGESSYISRLKKIDKAEGFDIFVCQLSTNDASLQYPIGEITGGGNEHDTDTICGAIEYIIEYVYKTWKCPVVFYTNCHYDNEVYCEMVQKLETMSKEYTHLYIIDLFTDRMFNDLSDEDRKRYMKDQIHPTYEGYLKWWTPKIEKCLCDVIMRWERENDKRDTH